MDAIRQEPKQLVTGFWRTGLVLVLVAVALLLGEGAQYLKASDSVANAAVRQVRDNHPNAAWAFREWDDCTHGRGRYADGQKPVYFTLAQCNDSIAEQAEQRGEQALVDRVIADQSTAISAAQSKVAPAWPLSLIF